MRRVLLLLLAVAWLAAPVVAQTAPRVYWEHDGANLTHFTCQIDSGDQVSLSGLVTQDGTTYSALLSSCGTLTAGAHTLYIRACNGATCTAHAGIYVVKL